MKTLILALGNPILSDDAVGFEVADRIAKRTNEFDILKESNASLDLLPKFQGYQRLVIIDAIQLGSAPIGTVHKFSLEDFASTIRHSSPHDINFATVFEIGRQFGYHIPADIRIFGVEVMELRKFSQGCTPQVQAKLDEITENILVDLRS